MKKFLFVILTFVTAISLIGCKEKVTPELSFNEKEVTVMVGDSHKLEYKLTEGFELEWEVVDDKVVSVKEGTITGLKIGSTKVVANVKKHKDVKQEIKVKVIEKTIPVEKVIITGEKEGRVGETIQLDAEIVPSNADNQNIIWDTTDSEIALVSSGGLVTLMTAGKVEVIAEIDGTVYGKFEIEVKPDKTEELLNYIIENTVSEVGNQTITYYGSDNIPHLIGESVSFYLFNDETNVIRNMINASAPNNPNRPLDSIEWVVVHDTANTRKGAGAKANSDYANNPINAESSWHYTTGNDGIYQQLEDNMIGWHAGDGTRVKFEFYKTNIKATKMFPLVTISEDGYYEIEGQKTDVAAPRLSSGEIPTTADINTNGIRAVVGDDGYYHLPKTGRHAFSSRIAMYGGNRNGIGIEMAVDQGSDVWLTWQRTAKLSAELLARHDLKLDRVVTHNHFSNKDCPKTMMYSNNMENFDRMLEVEHHIRTNFEGFKVEFTSHNPEIVANNGRVINIPKEDTVVEYTIKVTGLKGETVEATHKSLIKGLGK